MSPAVARFPHTRPACRRLTDDEAIGCDNVGIDNTPAVEPSMTISLLRATRAASLGALTFAAILIQHHAVAEGKSAIGAWGVDLTAMDRSVAPGDDFFRHVNGAWLRTTTIPADRSRWGIWDMVIEKSTDEVIAAIEAAEAGSPRTGTVPRKAVDYFRSYVDVATIERLGL